MIYGFLASTVTLRVLVAQTTNPSNPPPDSAIPDDSKDDLRDYVPCLMDRHSLFAMRGRNAPGRPVDPKKPVSNDEAQKAISAASKKYQGSDVATFVSGANQLLQSKINSSSLTYGDVSTAISSQAQSMVDVAKERDKAAKTTNNSAATPSASTVSQEGAKALQAADQFPRPKDIGCSMAVYPWNVARMVFGRTVANNFLAVQVTVRNLDQDHEFLIHDAELAVDATSSQLERFEEGTEKQAVRGVTVYGQNYDRRAIFSHSVESIGIILASIIGLPQPASDNLTAASGSYSSGFIPSFEKLFPDLSTNNLNNLNDLGFSAAAASRIVVPKGGSVPFVIFIPLKPLEQACWLQKGYVAGKDYYPETACNAIYSKEGNVQVAVDNPATWIKNGWSKQPQIVKFSKWSPDQVAALEKHAFAVVAGTHIQVATTASAAVRSISCPGTTNNNGTLLIATVSGTLTCTLTGASLDTLTTIRLKPQISGSTFKTFDSPLIQSGDSTTAKFTLSAANIASLTDASYSLFGVDKTSTESDLHFTWTIVPAPVVSASPIPSTTVLATVQASGFSLPLAGATLSQVVTVSLRSTAGVLATATVSNPTDSALTVKFDKIPAAVAATAYKIWLSDDATGTTSIDAKQSVTFQ